ncbi:pullulanase PulA [Massilia sp. WF1]|uniref:pullulanase-type alpha-1,6-glucosidase n=1 Tax=unclassified Massilia TaxID=2609279 RepID=UPI00064A9D38|nr:MULTISPECIES: pullulanase-type alpha-1,6-glucosidase [unclassified Massilia]ALK98301.1 pullulanase PulA [Massilia sp. WG5]KLU37121.1 pullulanase PulA [Massilia sp. WF1]
MLNRRSLTSRLRFGAAVGLSALLAGCGAGDVQQGSTSGTRLLAQAASASATPVAPGNIRMHFHRVQNDTAQWGVYSWDGPQNPSPAWISGRFMFTNTDAFGGYVDIPLAAGKSAIWFLVTDGNGTKNCGADQHADLNADIASKGQDIWMLEGDCTVYKSQPALSYGSLAFASAHWLSATTLAWPGAPAGGSYKLFYAANGGLAATPDAATGLAGADGSFTLSAAPLSDAIRQKYPHLAGATGLQLAAADAAKVAQLASGQFAIAQYDGAGNLVQVTSLQMAGMLDDVFARAASNAQLGVSFDRAGVPTFRVWAPTAKSVSLNVYPSASAPATASVAMSADAASGVWRYTAPDASWTNRAYYTYTVNVLSRWANNALVTNTVTDPYSLSLNANSTRSFVANLDSATLKPAGWDDQRIPKLDAPTDIALYELHVRDFSALDTTVPAAHRGKYLAFTDLDANPMRHLRELQKSGMTHIHLLPSFDFASVNEAGCVLPSVPNAAADSTAQQAAVAASQDSDCFNWGYDPVHYNAPEGSYATDANDGAARVREFRAMVQSLHETGLRVTMDVVYNHTSQSQQGPLSVLDRIVPTYYYRLGANGSILNDSCCADTAQENTMMGKLMIDSVSLWARQYKVDSFRFDIMGFTPLELLKRLQAGVNQAAGRDIYLYGEAWNFGSVANDARFVQARQANMAGTGIGSFNDRMRDAVRGGGCCDGGSALVTQQGFINGAWLDPNAQANQSRDDALRLADMVRVSLSGTLRDYRFTDRFGSLRTNAQIDYFGQQAGFAANPSEVINYIEAHDNQTLFDINAFRLPQSTLLSDRVRVQTLGASIVLLSQGVPFIHAGQEILRSKSLDRDSYNAGDWFNRLDYSYGANNFGVGLPMAGPNQDNWGIMAPILTNPLIRPDTRAILSAKGAFEDLLAIRKDTSLFRLRTAQDVIDRLKFHNVGPSQVPGAIVMEIDGNDPGKYAGAQYKGVVVVFNVDKVAKTFAVPALKGRKLQLHRIQRNGSDEVVKASAFDSASGGFSIPARTTAVFVQNAND